MGGFCLGSTIVLVFEAPPEFEFKVRDGEKVRVGQALGDLNANALKGLPAAQEESRKDR